MGGNILVTQRVTQMEGINERRDALDIKWSEFLFQCGYMPIILPNAPELARHYIKHFRFDGILLTGGNDLAAYGGDAPERDELETLLIKYAIKHNIPLIGVCRGMQMIQHYAGVKLKRAEGHIRQRHTLVINGDIKNVDEINRDEIEVNSYHNFTADEMNDKIETLAKASDGSVEAIRLTGKEIYGIMWHPERERPFSGWDIEFFKSIFY